MQLTVKVDDLEDLVKSVSARLESMPLGQKQRLFPLMQALLVLKAYQLGYELTDGDAYRDPRLHGAFGEKKAYGEAFSCHKLRLAKDFNLFKDGKFLTASEDHRVLGEYWESLGGSWGGRFKDGNHYSIAHQGKK